MKIPQRKSERRRTLRAAIAAGERRLEKFGEMARAIEGERDGYAGRIPEAQAPEWKVGRARQSVEFLRNAVTVRERRLAKVRERWSDAEATQEKAKLFYRECAVGEEAGSGAQDMSGNEAVEGQAAAILAGVKAFEERYAVKLIDPEDDLIDLSAFRYSPASRTYSGYVWPSVMDFIAEALGASTEAVPEPGRIESWDALTRNAYRMLRTPGLLHALSIEAAFPSGFPLKPIGPDAPPELIAARDRLDAPRHVGKVFDALAYYASVDSEESGKAAVAIFNEIADGK
jgi:hypothetical protein